MNYWTDLSPPRTNRKPSEVRPSRLPSAILEQPDNSCHVPLTSLCPQPGPLCPESDNSPSRHGSGGHSSFRPFYFDPQLVSAASPACPRDRCSAGRSHRGDPRSHCRASRTPGPGPSEVERPFSACARGRCALFTEIVLRGPVRHTRQAQVAFWKPGVGEGELVSRWPFVTEASWSERDCAERAGEEWSVVTSGGRRPLEGLRKPCVDAGG